MAKYEVNGQLYEFPDEIAPDQAFQLIQEHQGGAPQAASTPTPEAPPPVYPEVPDGGFWGSIDPSGLANNEDWIRASGVRFKMDRGRDWDYQKDGSPSDLAEYGLDVMGWFNYNLPRMGVDAYKIKSASEDEKKAFLYMLDVYDNLKLSWGGAGRFVKGAATDPTNWIGLSSLGLTAAGGQAAKLASKEALKEMLRLGVYAGVENAATSAAQSAIRQTAEGNAGRGEGVELGRTLVDTAVGAAAGFTLGATADAVAIGARQWRKAAEKAAEATIPTGIRPPDLNAPSAPQGSPVAGKVEQAATTPAAPAQAAPTASVEASNVIPFPTAKDKSPDGNAIFEAIKAVAKDSGMREPVVGRQEAIDASKPATDLLLSVKPSEMSTVVEELRRTAVTAEQKQILDETLKNATANIDNQWTELYQQVRTENDPKVLDALLPQLRQLEEISNRLKPADTDASSLTGRGLGSRVGFFNTGERRGLTVDTILRDRGIDPAAASKADIESAREEFFQTVEKWMVRARERAEVRDLDAQRELAIQQGDFGKLMLLDKEKDRLLSKFEQEEAIKNGAVPSLWRRGVEISNSYTRKLAEMFIGNVMTPRTFLVNAIPSFAKTVYKPLLNYVVKGPLDRAAFNEMTATYSAMLSNVATASRMARVAFDYERSLLSTNVSDLAVLNPEIKGRFGRLVRFIPRVLGATDEFFTQINYRGFVAGQAAAEATHKGIAKGLKGADLDQYINRETNRALKHAFADKVDNLKVMEILRNMGESRGFKDEKLYQWMQVQFDNNKNLFREALNVSARDYADDIAFRRAFSGQNSASSAAKWYEQAVQRHPWMRIAGQLFFRTPVRVLEEGLRMTPGANLFAPNFLGDLMGKNGVARQVRAQGEALASIAFTGAAVTLFAQGKLTGAGPGAQNDPRQRNNRQAAGDWQPYSIRIGDKWYSYRLLDPFATPIKIVANAMERLSELQYRESQGENVSQDIAKLGQYLSVAAGSTVQAIRDANLVDGAEQLIKMTELMTNPETTGQSWEKLFNQKLFAPMIPSTARQGWAAITGEEDMNDPVTIEQFWKSMINPGGNETPKRYDLLGNIRQNPMPWAFLGQQWTTPEGRAGGRAENELQVLKTLSDIEIATGTNFTLPFRIDKPGFEGLDLRTQRATDGSSWYDKLQEYTRENIDVDLWHDTLVTNDTSVGAKSADGEKVVLARKLFKAVRDEAWNRLISEEAEIERRVLDGILQKERGMLGERDSPFLPYR